MNYNLTDAYYPHRLFVKNLRSELQKLLDEGVSKDAAFFIRPGLINCFNSVQYGFKVEKTFALDKNGIIFNKDFDKLEIRLIEETDKSVTIGYLLDKIEKILLAGNLFPEEYVSDCTEVNIIFSYLSNKFMSVPLNWGVPVMESPTKVTYFANKDKEIEIGSYFYNI